MIHDPRPHCLLPQQVVQPQLRVHAPVLVALVLPEWMVLLAAAEHTLLDQQPVTHRVILEGHGLHVPQADGAVDAIVAARGGETGELLQPAPPAGEVASVVAPGKGVHVGRLRGNYQERIAEGNIPRQRVHSAGLGVLVGLGNSQIVNPDIHLSQLQLLLHRELPHGSSCTLVVGAVRIRLGPTQPLVANENHVGILGNLAVSRAETIHEQKDPPPNGLLMGN
mmetsp:Transcript_107994/g.247653  ORF Transcript_107994/g.247653 Transcript_107994/m.247653 type:complete len:223 (-) Transcript_107994:167-835(-)